MRMLRDTRRLALALLAGGCVGTSPVPLERFARRPACFADSAFTVYARFTSAATPIPFTKLIVRRLTDTGADTVSIITPLTYAVPASYARLVVRPTPIVAGLILGPALELADSLNASR